MAACLSFCWHQALGHPCLGMRINHSFETLEEKVTYIFRLFNFCNFFAIPFSPILSFLLQWLTLCWTCFQFKNFWERIIKSGSFHHGIGWQEILLWVFHSLSWAFLQIFQAPLGQSLWSGYHWKKLSLLQKFSIGDASFGQSQWRQKWKKGQG